VGLPLHECLRPTFHAKPMHAAHGGPPTPLTFCRPGPNPRATALWSTMHQNPR
jgi:hypothetical protein